MEFKYFTNIRDFKDLKNEYKKLVKKYHPDVGGSGKEMRDINCEFIINLDYFNQKDKINNEKVDFSKEIILSDISKINNKEVSEESILDLDIWDLEEKIKELGIAWRYAKELKWHLDKAPGYYQDSDLLFEMIHARPEQKRKAASIVLNYI